MSSPLVGVPRSEFLIDQLTALALDRPDAEIAIIGGGGALLAAAISASESTEPPWSVSPAGRGTPADVVLGRNAPDGFTVTRSVQVATGGGFLTDKPSTTPTSSQPAGWAFESEFVSAHSDDNLIDLDAALQRFADRAESGRNFRKARLVYPGAGVDAICWLTSYEGVYGPSWPVSGLPTRLLVRLSFVLATEHAFTAQSLRPRETTWRTLNPGETFELIAGEQYGDPGLSVLLRRINPTVLLETPGERIKLLDRDHPRMRESAAPRCPAFVERFADTVNAIARARAGRSAGKAWTALARLREPDPTEPLVYPE